MAEAHSAVAFSFSITHEGWDVNFDREVLHLVWQSGVRSWKKRLARFQNSIHNGVYPGHLWSLYLLISVTAAVHFSGIGTLPWNVVDRIVTVLPGTSPTWQFVACAVATLSVWLAGVFTLRYSLKLLLMYKGWMYEERGKGRRISLRTQLWVLMVRLLSGWNKPKLYSFQGSLPRLPLPPLHQTLERYLRSVRPLLNDDDYTRMERLANEFEAGIGVKLQRYLLLKSWWATNYVSDWWEEYVYLRGRSPLMVNSNFYGMDAILTSPTNSQAARAASVIHTLLHLRRLIERQELNPIMVQGLVPLCSAQYERVFNTTRVPGPDTDRIVHFDDSNHIVVYHKGRFFKVIIYKRRLLKPCEIQKQIEHIIQDESKPAVGEERVAALTAGERSHWAAIRQQYFFKGPNKATLDAIEKAAFVVALDDVPYEFDKKHPEKLDRFGKTLLHGKGYDRWFDKSFTLCIGTNGRIGFNAEHSWADAAVLSHLWELVIIEEDKSDRADAPILGHLWELVIFDELYNRYDSKGNTVGEPEISPPPPLRLQWNINPECSAAIEQAVNVAQALINDVDLRIYVHDAYGKGFMKQCSLSPDAYIQMSLQLAYYRDAGKFSLTYEASMTRLFREGRTETVRPCTVESAEWVKAMNDNGKSSVEEKVRLLRRACQQHQIGYQDAMCGKGIDRHLFCLYVISKYLEVDSAFLREVLSEPWRLSTSQTPHGQTDKLNLKERPNCISAGGGFGPVADDGYGVSYIIAGEDILFFHISNKRSSKQTSCGRFAVHIEHALADMRQLFIDYNKQNGSASH